MCTAGEQEYTTGMSSTGSNRPGSLCSKLQWSYPVRIWGLVSFHAQSDMVLFGVLVMTAFICSV